MVSVVPSHRHRLFGCVFGAWEYVMNLRVYGPVMFVRGRTFAAQAKGRGEADGVVHGIIDVATHISESPGAERQAFAPLAWVIIALQIRHLGADAAPVIPVKICRHRISAVWAWVHIAPFLVAPSVHLGDFAKDGAVVGWGKDRFEIRILGMKLNAVATQPQSFFDKAFSVPIDKKLIA